MSDGNDAPQTEGQELFLRYFKLSEFACKCGKCDMARNPDKYLSMRLRDRLGLMRHKAGTAFVINSGLRCADYNAKVGGKSHSAHTTGEAADIQVSGTPQRYLITREAYAAGITRIGQYKTFIHVDVSTSLPQHVMW